LRESVNVYASPLETDMPKLFRRNANTLDKLMQRKFELIEPMITNIVRRTLPWPLSREVSQSQLPL